MSGFLTLVSLIVAGILVTAITFSTVALIAFFWRMQKWAAVAIVLATVLMFFAIVGNGVL